MFARIAQRLYTPNTICCCPIRASARYQPFLSHSVHLRARTLYTYNRRPAKQSAVSYTTIAVSFLVSVSGAYLYQSSGASPRSREGLVQTSSVSSDDLLAVSLDGMPSENPPGRPGNLTPEQEQKLREFWALVLKVFNVVEDGPPIPSETATPGTTTPAGTDAGEKDKKKKRLGLFKKKDKSQSDAKDASNEKPAGKTAGLDIADGEDKHGQIQEFKAAMASNTPEELRAALWSMAKHDHPDGLLLRFLRARKWDINAALVMLISTMHWRAEEMKVDSDIILNGEETMLAEAAGNKDAADFIAQLRMGKSYLHGRDKEGRPLCVVRVRLHHGGEQTEKSLERFTVWTIETARMLLQPPVDTATIVFDMTNFSMANMDYTPVKFMIKCFEANYPESLGAVLVHKAPWLFQGIWKIIRGWLDPVVAAKVHFTTNTQELTEFIDMKSIPTELGGEEKWEYTYIEPAADENALMKDTATRDALQAERTKIVETFEEKTVQWVDGDDSEELKKERLQIAHQLRDNYWKLDPYIRARTLYDRTGLIKPGISVPAEPATIAPAKVETSETDLD